jgi:hypothetical protein
MAVTRLGLGGYSTANLWPGGTGGSVVDFAGVFTAIAPVLTGDIAVTLASFVDFAGDLSGIAPSLAGDLAVSVAGSFVDLAGAVVVASAFTADFTGNITNGSKYGLGPYGIGPYSELDTNGVSFIGDLATSVSLSGGLEVMTGVGWRPAEPCPPSMWTPVPACVETELVE